MNKITGVCKRLLLRGDFIIRDDCSLTFDKTLSVAPAVAAYVLGEESGISILLNSVADDESTGVPRSL